MGETCGKRIRKLRMHSGMSQEELAGKLNISTSAVGMYEQSRREPRGNALVAIAKVFGVSTDYLLTGTENIGRKQESDLDRSADESAVLLMNDKQPTITVHVDTSEINAALEKIKELRKLAKESIGISDIETCELVEELKKREGVITRYAEPYQNKGIVVTGPAQILVVID